ncbi:MAG TPA: type VII secretion system-associated protein [Pseudonocardiaceae bacterium]
MQPTDRPALTPEMREQARRFPNQWLLVVDRNHDTTHGIHSEAIIGRYRVGPDGEITDEYVPNPRYRPAAPAQPAPAAPEPVLAPPADPPSGPAAAESPSSETVPEPQEARENQEPQEPRPPQEIQKAQPPQEAQEAPGPQEAGAAQEDTPPGENQAQPEDDSRHDRQEAAPPQETTGPRPEAAPPQENGSRQDGAPAQAPPAEQGSTPGQDTGSAAEPDHSAPPPITDTMREEARRKPNSWLYVVDPFFARPGAEVPNWGVRGAYRVDAQGQLTGEWSPNPQYRPSPTARGWPTPRNELELTLQLAGAGYVDERALIDALVRAELLMPLVEQPSGGFSCALLPAEDPQRRTLVAFSSPELVPADYTEPLRPHPTRQLLELLTEKVDLWLNPGYVVSTTLPIEVIRTALQAAGEPVPEGLGEDRLRELTRRVHAGQAPLEELVAALRNSQILVPTRQSETGGIILELPAPKDGGRPALPAYTCRATVPPDTGQRSRVTPPQLVEIFRQFDLVLDPGSDAPVRIPGEVLCAAFGHADPASGSTSPEAPRNRESGN